MAVFSLTTSDNDFSLWQADGDCFSVSLMASFLCQTDGDFSLCQTDGEFFGALVDSNLFVWTRKVGLSGRAVGGRQMLRDAFHIQPFRT